MNIEKLCSLVSAADFDLNKVRSAYPAPKYKVSVVEYSSAQTFSGSTKCVAVILLQGEVRYFFDGIGEIFINQKSCVHLLPEGRYMAEVKLQCKMMRIWETGIDQKGQGLSHPHEKCR